MLSRRGSRFLATLACFELVLAGGGCASVDPAPLPTQADLPRAREIDPDADLARLELGRRRFIAKCAGCHELPAASDLAPEEWPEELDVMGKKAKLRAEDRQAIELYLRTVSLAKPAH
jgi:hypothetical protein